MKQKPEPTEAEKDEKAKADAARLIEIKQTQGTEAARAEFNRMVLDILKGR
jgi:hypothetical protein